MTIQEIREQFDEAWEQLFLSEGIMADAHPAIRMARAFDKVEAVAIEFREGRERIREAMKGYDDSDLVSLAEALSRSHEAYCVIQEELRNVQAVIDDETAGNCDLRDAVVSLLYHYRRSE